MTGDLPEGTRRILRELGPLVDATVDDGRAANVDVNIDMSVLPSPRANPSETRKLVSDVAPSVDAGQVRALGAWSEKGRTWPRRRHGGTTGAGSSVAVEGRKHHPPLGRSSAGGGEGGQPD